MSSEVTTYAVEVHRHPKFDQLMRLHEPTLDEVQEAMVRAGRNYGPYIVATLHGRRKLSPEVAAWAVPEAWLMVMVTRPLKVLTQRDWRELFVFAGFTVDGKPASRPSGPVVLYRGAPARYRRRWSWTSGIEVARKFASGELWESPEPSETWTATMPPQHLFAVINGRDEAEYVVDTRGLRIIEASVWLRKPTACR